MNMILSMSIISLTISLIITALALLLGKKSNKEQEKNSPFECGFSPAKKARQPLSLRFFLVTIIFLIFDAEIALILPLGQISLTSYTLMSSFIAIVITIILIAGLIHEWNQGALNWTP
uniref:NADH dehydrogenase subunit 3 n=1 Tax=Cyphocaris challengeri TaxID=3018532 RepID=UPI0022FD664F|nr:NADH dehydrogenase subunit 3 [Cyphocaris challengeri]WBQ48838.1 NADH dehydrogenase subunit 3 [Cyphocaris challengeri]